VLRIILDGGTQQTNTLKAVVLHPEFYASQRSPGMLQRMPSLVLKHAGTHSQFLCHKSSTLAVISSAVRHDKEADFLTDYEIKYFLFHLLVALDSLHSKGWYTEC
jgi:hypothetical protein